MPTHITARLAWHNDGWNGAVCNDPESKTYCVGAKSYPGDVIARERDLAFEKRCAMRRIASLTLALILSGCGYKTWWNPSFTGGYNPNLPASNSENMRRVQGQEPSVPPLTTERGDIWPGPLAPAPTLKDLEATGGLTSQPEAPVPGSPLSRGMGVPYPSPNPNAGSFHTARKRPTRSFYTTAGPSFVQ